MEIIVNMTTREFIAASKPQTILKRLLTKHDGAARWKRSDHIVKAVEGNIPYVVCEFQLVHADDAGQEFIWTVQRNFRTKQYVLNGIESMFERIEL